MRAAIFSCLLIVSTARADEEHLRLIPDLEFDLGVVLGWGFGVWGDWTLKSTSHERAPVWSRLHPFAPKADIHWLEIDDAPRPRDGVRTI